MKFKMTETIHFFFEFLLLKLGVFGVGFLSCLWSSWYRSRTFWNNTVRGNYWYFGQNLDWIFKVLLHGSSMIHDKITHKPELPWLFEHFWVRSRSSAGRALLEKTADTILFVSVLLEHSYQVLYNHSSVKGLGGPELMKIMFEKRLFPILITV